MTIRKELRLPFAADRDGTVIAWFRAQNAAMGLDFERELIYIAASDSRARWIRDGLARELGALPQTHFGTIDGIVARLASRVTLPGNPAPSSVAREYLRSAAMEVLAASGENKRPSRLWVDQIDAALSRVAVSFAPADRSAELQRLEIEAKKAGDAALETRLIFLREVSEAFTKRLQEARLIDESDLEWLYLQRLPEVLANVHAIFVDDVYRLGPAQRALLEAITRHDGVDITFLTRGGDDNAPNEAATLSVRKWLPKKLTREVLAPTEARAPNPKRVCAPSQRSEARAIVHEIKRRHVEDGVALSDLAACMVTHDQQQELLQELEFNGVPVRTQMEEPLTRMPLVDGVLSLMRAIAQGGEREQLLAALRSPWLRGLESIVEPELAKADFKLGWRAFTERLSLVARKALVVGGISGQSLEKTWCLRLRELAAQITEATTAEQKKELSYKGVNERDLPLLSAAIALMTRLDELQRGPRQDLIAKLLDFVEELALSKTLFQVFTRAKLYGDAQRRIHAISLDQFQSALSAFARVDSLFGGNAATSLATLLEDLQDELDSLLVRPRMDVAGVYLGGLLDAREVGFAHLVIGGLNDGEMPFNISENLYLPTRIREVAQHLSESQRDTLAGESAPLALYRHLFASAIGASRESLLLTMPRHVDGGEAEPSLPFREELEGAGIDLADFMDSPHESPSASRALGSADLQEHIASKGVEAITKAAKGTPLETPWAARALNGANVNAQRDAVSHLPAAFEGELVGHAREVAQRYKPDGLVPFISNSSLENYAGCPIRYFFREVLGLDEEDRPADEISPMDKGTLIHNALEAFFLEVRREINASEFGRYLDKHGVVGPEGTDLSTLPLLDLQVFAEVSGRSASEVLREIFAEKAKAFPFPSTTWQEWLRRIDLSLAEGSTVYSELSAFLFFEYQGQERGVYPWLLEYAFGVEEEGSGPSYRITGADGKEKMQIRGFIDRVDVIVDKGHEPQGFLVRDYKVSKSSKKKELVAGVRFQLPIYTAAIDEHFKNIDALGFFYHLITPAFDFKIDSPVMNAASMAALSGSTRRKTIDPASLSPAVMNGRIAAIENAMEHGMFHHALVLGEAACNYCAFARMCAKRSVKMLAHNQAPSLLHGRGAYVPDLIPTNGDN